VNHNRVVSTEPPDAGAYPAQVTLRRIERTTASVAGVSTLEALASTPPGQPWASAVSWTGGESTMNSVFGWTPALSTTPVITYYNGSTSEVDAGTDG
jgi:hypothetical protein